MVETLDDLLERVGADKPQKTEAEIAAEQAEIAKQESERLESEKAQQEAEEERLKLEAEANKTDEEKEAEILAAEEASKKSFSELLKTVKPEGEKKEVEIPQEFLAELESYKTKIKAYESDPLVKAVTAEATKAQLIAIAAELNGKDYSNSSYQDLIASEIRDVTGMSGEELEEQISEAMVEFNALPKWKQMAAEKEIRAKFQATAKKGESPTLEALESAYLEKAKGFKTPEQAQNEIKEIATKEKAAIKELGKQLVGSNLYGVEFTADVLNEIVEKDYDVNKVADFVDEKGDLNIGEFIQSKFISKNLAKMIELAEERGAKKANQGNAKTKTIKSTGVTTKQIDAKAQELTDLGLGHVVEAPKSIKWRE